MYAKRTDEVLNTLLPVVMVVLLVYVYLAMFTEFTHLVLTFLEVGIVGYFVAELGVKWRLSPSWRYFMRNYWLKIILILPILRLFRIGGVLGIFGRSGMVWARYVPYAQKLVKIPGMAQKTKPIYLAALGYLSHRERAREGTQSVDQEMDVDSGQEHTISRKK